MFISDTQDIQDITDVSFGVLEASGGVSSAGEMWVDSWIVLSLELNFESWNIFALGMYCH